jgi:hypothetical protein
LALKVGANFPAESKQHRFVQNFKGHADGVWQVCAAQWGSSTSLLASASAGLRGVLEGFWGAFPHPH